MTNESYCDRFNLTQTMRNEWMKLLDLGRDEAGIAQILRTKVIEPNVDAFVEHFYRKLGTDKRAQRILTQGYAIPRLQQTLRDYLLTLGQNYRDQDYFEKRLVIGFIHARIGVDLPLYIGAYRLLQESLIGAIGHDWPDRAALISFVLKIMALDMALASLAYHETEVVGLEQRLEKLKTRTRHLKSRLEIDTLTRVLSRASILDFLDRVLNKVREQELDACVLIGDIDRFKNVNDTHGHVAGDIVLRHVATRIKKSLRDDDAVGRYGGEEFLIVLSGAALAHAREIAERIRTHVANDVVSLTNADVAVTISIGLTALSSQDTAKTAIERADAAMYKAKNNGRNRVEQL